jgi:hypothetical protein
MQEVLEIAAEELECAAVTQRTSNDVVVNKAAVEQAETTTGEVVERELHVASRIEGLLKKRPRSKASSGRNWMSRLFSLNWGLLSWCKVKGESMICLADIASVVEGKDELVVLHKQLLGYTWSITFHDTHLPVVNLACNSRSEVLLWVESLSKMLAAPCARTQQCSEIGTLKMSSKSGVLYRQDGRKWEETSACVCSERLVLQTRKPCGAYELCEATVKIDAASPCVFHVRGPHKDEDLSLMCDDEQTCKAWVAHIQMSIETVKRSDNASSSGKCERELRIALRTLLEQREETPKVQIRKGEKVIV